MDPISLGPSSAPDLAGRVAVVTGAAGGLGSAIARVLASFGASVALVDVRRPDATERHLVTLGARARAYECDVADEDCARRILSSTQSDWGRLDILVNNAGVGGTLDLPDAHPGAIRDEFAINLGAFILWTKHAAPIMKLNQGGKIVNVSSISARVGAVQSVHAERGSGRSGPLYTAAKGGVLAFTRWSAQEFAVDGVLVNAICPGPIRTDANKEFEYVVDRAPLPIVGSPVDVAFVVLFLASQMSNHVTGQTINVDGGLRFD